jgi:hypothetical protein
MPAWQVDRDYEITPTANSVTNTPDLECLNVGLCPYRGKFVLTCEVTGFNKLDMIPLDENAVSYKLAILLIKNL